MSLTFSCEKRFVKSEIETKWENCRDFFDKKTTNEKLVGQWQYIGIGCGECANPGIKPVEENIKIVITSDNKILTYKDGILIKTSMFELTNKFIDSDKSFYLKTIPVEYENYYTYGTIQFCENMVGFRSSSTDGIDFFFERKN